MKQEASRFDKRLTILGLAGLSLAGVALPGMQPKSVAAPVAGPPSRGQLSAQPSLSPQAQRVTAALRRALQARVSSPGRQLRLDLRPTARSDQGYFSEVFIAARPAQIKKLRISELTMRARAVRINVPLLMQQGKISTLAADTRLRAVVTENDLTNLLAQGRGTRAMGLRVKYLSDRVRISGNWRWSWFNGPVVGEGRLRLLPNFKVHFDILSLKLNGAEVPQFVKNRFSQRINPVIDYEDLPFRPRFKELRMVGDKAVLIA